jgi:hypothetical protein
MRIGFSNLGMRSVALSAAMQLDASGNVIPGSALSQNDQPLIACILRYVS